MEWRERGKERAGKCTKKNGEGNTEERRTEERKDGGKGKGLRGSQIVVRSRKVSSEYFHVGNTTLREGSRPPIEPGVDQGFVGQITALHGRLEPVVWWIKDWFDGLGICIVD